MRFSISTLVLVSVGLLAGCGRNPHDGGMTVQGNGACAGCHMADYQATANYSVATSRNLNAVIIPNHVALGLATTCENCHSQQYWVPATAGMHAENIFPIVRPSAHQNILCQDCHNVSITPDFKLNNDCTSVCHTQAWFTTHPAGVAWNANDKQFCRGCHPDGTVGSAKTGQGLHAENLFPISTGLHAGILCTGCHDTTISTNYQVNPNCTKTCHTAANTEGFMASAAVVNSNKHNGATFDNTNAMFCRTCHSMGQGATQIISGTTLTSLGMTNHSFNQGHQGAHGCTFCHNAVYDPTVTGVTGQRDFSQNQDCTNAGGGGCHGQRRGGG